MGGGGAVTPLAPLTGPPLSLSVERERSDATLPSVFSRSGRVYLHLTRSRTLTVTHSLSHSTLVSGRSLEGFFLNIFFFLSKSLQLFTAKNHVRQCQGIQLDFGLTTIYRSRTRTVHPENTFSKRRLDSRCLNQKWARTLPRGPLDSTKNYKKNFLKIYSRTIHASK